MKEIEYKGPYHLCHGSNGDGMHCPLLQQGGGSLSDVETAKRPQGILDCYLQTAAGISTTRKVTCTNQGTFSCHRHRRVQGQTPWGAVGPLQVLHLQHLPSPNSGKELKLAFKLGATPTCYNIPHIVPLYRGQQVDEGFAKASSRNCHAAHHPPGATRWWALLSPQAKKDCGHVIPQVRLSPKRKNDIVQWPEKHT